MEIYGSDTFLVDKKIKEEGRYSVSGCSSLQLRVYKEVKTYCLRYTFNGKRKSINLGSADVLSLADARLLGNQYLKQIAEGIDPGEQKWIARENSIETKKQKISFEEVALQWVQERKNGNYWKYNVKGERDTLSRFVNHIFPYIGGMDINAIEPENVRDMILPIWNRSPSTSSKILANVRAVFRWSIALRLRNNRENPASLEGSLGILLEPYNNLRKAEENFAGLDFHEIPKFVKSISELHSRSSEMLLFSILTATRSKAVRYAKWVDVDLDDAKWIIPLEDDKTKTQQRERTVFLNTPAIQLLKLVTRFSKSPYIFCNANGSPYSDAAMNQLIRKAHVRQKLIDGIGWVDKEKNKRTGKECIITQHARARSDF